MRDVDDDDVHAGAHQLGGALEIVAGCADGGADAQPAALVAGRERQPPLTQQIACGDQPEQPAVVGDERQLLDLAIDHQLLGVRQAQRASMHDEPIDRRHAVETTRTSAPFTNRTSRSVSSPASRRWSSTTTSVPTRDRRIWAVASASERRRRHAVGIGDHAVLRALDDLHLAHLRLDLARPEAAVDDPDAAFFGLHDRHRRARDRVHVGRHDGPLEPDAPREPA